MLINGYQQYGRFQGPGRMAGLSFHGAGATFGRFGEVTGADVGAAAGGIGQGIGAIFTGIANMFNPPAPQPYQPGTYPPGYTNTNPYPTQPVQQAIDPVLVIGGGVAVLGLIMLLRK